MLAKRYRCRQRDRSRGLGASPPYTLLQIRRPGASCQPSPARTRNRLTRLRTLARVAMRFWRAVPWCRVSEQPSAMIAPCRVLRDLIADGRMLVTICNNVSRLRTPPCPRPTAGLVTDWRSFYAAPYPRIGEVFTRLRTPTCNNFLRLRTLGSVLNVLLQQLLAAPYPAATTSRGSVPRNDLIKGWGSGRPTTSTAGDHPARRATSPAARCASGSSMEIGAFPFCAFATQRSCEQTTAGTWLGLCSRPSSQS